MMVIRQQQPCQALLRCQVWSTEAKLKASEQQYANLRVASFGQHTESEKYHHGCQQMENADELDLNGEDVPEEKIVEIANNLKQHKDMKELRSQEDRRIKTTAKDKLVDLLEHRWQPATVGACA